MAVDSPKIPLTNKPGVKNWVEKFNALGNKDNWIRRVAEHLKGKGAPEGIAIPTAVNAAQKACETGDLNFPGKQEINPGGRAEACAAYKTWTQAKAKAHAARATDMSAERACEAFRTIDLARAYLRFKDGEVMQLPRGAFSAYEDLAAGRGEAVDLAVSASDAQGFDQRFAQMGGRVKALAHEHGVFPTEKQHDTIAAHALAHGEPQALAKGENGSVIAQFANGQMHSFPQHGGSSDRLDNLPASGDRRPGLSAAEREAILAEEILKARKAISPDAPGNAPSFGPIQIAAIKGMARKRALDRINMLERTRAVR